MTRTKNVHLITDHIKLITRELNRKQITSIKNLNMLSFHNGFDLSTHPAVR